ncbi:MAG: glutathione S-transferase family protein [Kiloniellales bacterium]
MYRIYWRRQTGAFAPQVVLEEAGVPYEIVPIDTKTGEHRQPAYLKINPQGRVPALQLPDGSIMTESAAMVLYLADRHGKGKLAPGPDDPDRPRFLRWLFFMACNLYEADLRAYYPARYSTDGDAAAGIKAAAVRDMDEQWDMVEAALDPGPYLLGERESVLDPYMLMLASWHPDMSQLLAGLPRLKRACDLTLARPAIARVWAEHEAAA